MAYKKDGVWVIEGNETDKEIEELCSGNEQAFEEARPNRERIVDTAIAEIELEGDPIVH